MSLRETLPWNWGKKEVPVERGAETAGASAPARRSLLDLFDELAVHPFARPSWSSLPALGFGDDGSFLPVLDAKESDDEIRITVELPGLEEKDVEVSFKDDVLTIKGEKRSESKGGEKGAQWVERRYGSFRRAVPLPVDVDADKVQAHFKSGVLTVVAPRTGKPDQRHKSIPIQAG